MRGGADAVVAVGWKPAAAVWNVKTTSDPPAETTASAEDLHEARTASS
jgi:hypothetical protein